MKALMTLAAVGVMAAGALACESSCTKSKTDCKGENVQVVNAAAKEASCASKCTKGENVQVVNAAAKEASCASKCTKGENVQVVNAAAGAACASSCKKGAQVVNAAAKDRECSAACAEACKSGTKLVNASADDAACLAACAEKKAQKAAMIAKAKEIGMPMASFAVGDKATCCPLEAFAWAKEANVMPVATINGKEYECVEHAMKDWQTALSEKLACMTQVSYVVDGTETQCAKSADKMAQSCGKPMLTRVANREFHCNKTAKTTALKAVQAADAVPFVMTVAGAEYHCPMTASDAARLTGEPVLYNVAGAETCCKQTAMCILLASRIMATADALECTEAKKTVADTGA